MNYTLIIRKRAESHITETFNWYEDKRLGLGARFLLCIESVLIATERNPFIFQERYKNIRCALVPRFPYGVYYLIDKNKVVITSVFYLSRNPKLWKA